MSAALLGNYVPGTTFLHRLPAGVKLAALFLAGIVVIAVHGPASVAVLLTSVTVLVWWSGMGLGATLRALRAILVLAVLLAAYTTWQRGFPQAIETVGDLIGLVLLASVFTATTPVDDVLETITRLLGPLRRFGVQPDRVGLAFSLMIRAIPTTLTIAQETHDAAVARGLQRDPRARLTPLVIRVVAHARATGEALHARGIGDD